MEVLMAVAWVDNDKLKLAMKIIDGVIIFEVIAKFTTTT